MPEGKLKRREKALLGGLSQVNNKAAQKKEAKVLPWRKTMINQLSQQRGLRTLISLTTTINAMSYLKCNP
jgi:hypothetical protein